MGTTEDLPSSPTVSDNSKDEDPCYEPEEPEDALSDEQTEGPKSGPSALGSILQRYEPQVQRLFVTRQFVLLFLGLQSGWDGRHIAN